MQVRAQFGEPICYTNMYFYPTFYLITLSFLLQKTLSNCLLLLSLILLYKNCIYTPPVLHKRTLLRPYIK